MNGTGKQSGKLNLTALLQCHYGLIWRATSVVIICGLVIGTLTVDFLEAQKRGYLLSMSVSVPESGSIPKSRNPSYVMSLEKVQQLLIEVAQSPKSGQFVEAALEDTDITLADFLAMKLLRKQDKFYVIGFSLFTTDDQRKLRKVCGQFAENLAKAYLTRRSEFEEILSVYPMKNIDSATVAFVLLGCFSLDWDGLDITEELGYRFTEPPENEPFVWYADDKRAKEFSDKKGLYWGSHNEYLENGVAFTTFGDHADLNRCGFPDLAWQMARSLRITKSPKELKPILTRVGRRALYGSMLAQIGEIMMALRIGNKSEDEIRDVTGIDSRQTKDLLALLEGLEYIRKVSGRYEAAIPVFAREDRNMIQALLHLSREIMTPWLKQNYERLSANLAELAAFKYGQPFEVTFYKLWHEIFGITNRILVEKGMFIDPYGAGRKYKGYIPVVWHQSVIESE